ncbi:hypothetical protein Pelo_6089 [Pelomyxa schiedti]|nr:hypothetical protein Pelo_6089 [Pelomyxa schiedti]
MSSSSGTGTGGGGGGDNLSLSKLLAMTPPGLPQQQQQPMPMQMGALSASGTTTGNGVNNRQLPLGWGEYIDDSNRKYYFNTLNGESAWDFPVLPPNWSVHNDPTSGKIYYWNCISNESSWTLPQAPPVVPVAQPPPTQHQPFVVESPVVVEPHIVPVEVQHVNPAPAVTQQTIQPQTKPQLQTHPQHNKPLPQPQSKPLPQIPKPASQPQQTTAQLHPQQAQPQPIQPQLVQPQPSQPIQTQPVQLTQPQTMQPQPIQTQTVQVTQPQPQQQLPQQQQTVSQAQPTSSQMQQQPLAQQNSSPEKPPIVELRCSQDSSQAVANQLPAVIPQTPGLPLGWGIYKDDEGNSYFFNVLTGESRWDSPAISSTEDTPNSSTTSSADSQSSSDMRRLCVVQMLEAEKVLAISLGKLHSNVLCPVRYQPYDIDMNTFEVHFANTIAGLVEFQEKIIKSLTDCLGSWTSDSTPCKLYVDNVEWQQLYKDYARYNIEYEIVHWREKSGKFSTFINKLEGTNFLNAMTLVNLLNTPKDHLRHYEIVVDKLLHKTPQTHVDRPYVQQFQGLVSYLNEFITKCCELLKIQSSITEFPVAAHFLTSLPQHISEYTNSGGLGSGSELRVIIKQGPVSVNDKQGHLWLFNDELLVVEGEVGRKMKFLCMAGVSTSELKIDPKGGVQLLLTQGSFRCKFPSDAQLWQTCLQTAFSAGKVLVTTPAASSITSEPKRKEMCVQIANSESEYWVKLQEIQQTCIKPLQDIEKSKSTNKALREQIKKVVSNFNDVVSAHEQHVIALCTRQSEWASHNTLSDLFKPQSPVFVQHSAYLKHHREQRVALDGLSKSNNDAVVAVLKAKPYNSMLEDLAVPTKRIQDYRTFFRDMLKHTGPEHGDFARITAVLSTLSSINDSL